MSNIFYRSVRNFVSENANRTHNKSTNGESRASFKRWEKRVLSFAELNFSRINLRNDCYRKWLNLLTIFFYSSCAQFQSVRSTTHWLLVSHVLWHWTLFFFLSLSLHTDRADMVQSSQNERNARSRASSYFELNWFKSMRWDHIKR